LALFAPASAIIPSSRLVMQPVPADAERRLVAISRDCQIKTKDPDRNTGELEAAREAQEELVHVATADEGRVPESRDMAVEPSPGRMVVVR
jgi:hypothetical protein